VSVRDEVYDKLAADCPSFTGGFFQPQIADKNTTKPFGVIRVSGDAGLFRQGIIKTVHVAVHCARADFNDLDDLVYEVVDALDDEDVGGYYPIHTGTTGDANDDDRETIFRICEFEIKIAR
jgi:hypothetical protein